MRRLLALIWWASAVCAQSADCGLGENGVLAWLELTRKGVPIQTHAKLFHAPESWTAPALSDGRLFICQNQSGSADTKARLLCYDLRGP
jgi:outer membrane protein assembly factor BamB